VKLSLIGAALAVALGAPAVDRAAEGPLVLDLWPGQAPGETDPPPADEKMTGIKGSRLLINVSKPTITVFRPAADKSTGVAVVIAPGGGYNLLAWDHEGEDVAAWLNSLGITGVLLKYRVPQPASRPRDGPTFAPLQDAQRAIGLVRSKAADWGIDPKKVGFLGFSAGGHLTALAATNYEKRAYDPVDEADKLSCRPDFAVMVYPGGAVTRDGTQLAAGIRITKDTPPAFFAHCGDDRVTSENSVLLYLALKRAGVPAELHIYASGGHGFGLWLGKGPVSDWPKRCEEWLRVQKILGTTPAK
jgi:acetyl esterase/lipase